VSAGAVVAGRLADVVGDAARVGVHAALRASMAPHTRAFAASLTDISTVQAAQEAALARVRQSLAGTLVARRHPGVDRLHRLADLAHAAPLSTWDDIAPDVDAMAGGADGVRTNERVVRFERSGGSSGAQKLVPMTASSLTDMQRGIAPWLSGMYGARPALRSTSAYWSISPIGSKARPTTGGIPVGAADDSDYLPGPARALMRQVLVAVPALADFDDVEDCRYATLRLLVARPDLGLLSVWSPTFLSLLLDALDVHADRLLFDLERGGCAVPSGRADDVVARLPLRAAPARARALREHLRADGRLSPTFVWPRLSLVSLWTHGESARFVGDVERRLPGIALEPKGLLATEGIVSVPWPGARDPVLAVTSHVYEFLRDDGRVAPGWALDVGEDVEVVLSTTAGLLRYRLGDRVRVTGHVGAAPTLRFLGRAGVVSDLVGEKLGGPFVADVLARVASAAPFVMLAPVRAGTGRPHYRLYVDGVDDAAARALAYAVERALAEGHPYRYARALGQLGPVEAAPVAGASAQYEGWRTRRGQRAGDIKVPALCVDDDVHAALWPRAITDHAAQPLAAE